MATVIAPKVGGPHRVIRVALFAANLNGLSGVAEYYRQALPAVSSAIEFTVVSLAPSPHCDLVVPSLGLTEPWWTPEVSWRAPSLKAVRRVLDDLQPDIVHTADVHPLCLAALSASRDRSIATAAVFHTDLVGFARSAQLPPGSVRVLRALVRRVYSQADAVAARSAAAATAIARLVGVPVAHVRVLAAGVDSKRFSPRASSCPSGTHRLLAVSRLSPEKRLDIVIHSCEIVARKRRVAVSIVGRGPSRRKLSRLADHRTQFTGPLSGVALPAVYRGADIFVSASPAETLGQVLLEAQASGLPCVVSPSGAARHTIEPGVTGIVAAADEPEAFASAIDELLHDDQRRARMGSAARARIMNMSWTEAAADLERWYADVIDDGDGSQGRVH
jgi:phosphatidylinositol alpha 1,6-mannosyltransferase